mgnify:CR=1 FL=1
MLFSPNAPVGYNKGEVMIDLESAEVNAEGAVENLEDIATENYGNSWQEVQNAKDLLNYINALKSKLKEVQNG